MITNALSAFREDGQNKLADWLEMNIDEWEGINGKAYISPEKLQQTAEVLKAASSQPKNSAV